ncbi:GPI-anchor transamidase subunit K [Nematocida sp. AWRm77]|nr:GPI-anchor transamidase subunit K [Nematocida sp. AWRm77]
MHVMSKLCIQLLLGVLLGAAESLCRNKAILIDCSFQYENYRHASNVLGLQSLLEKNGYTEEDISVFMVDDVLDDPRNPFGQMCVGEEFLERGVDYTPKRRGASYFEVLNMVSGEDPVLLGADKSTNLLVYVTGHGGDGFIKHCNREYFYTEDFTRALSRLQEVREVGQVLFISDTCQAASLVDVSQLPANVCVLSTSKVGESSYSVDFNQTLRNFPIDMFVAHLRKAEGEGALQTSQKFFEIYEEVFPFSVLHSTLTVHGRFCFADFLYQRDSLQSSSLYI